MIAKIKLLKKYCSEYTKIENYEEALKSPIKYDLHHRREISENKSSKQLIAENLYYRRPPEELIFLERGEHMILHNKGKKSYMYGKPSHWKGKHPSEETRQKMSAARKGKHWTTENGHRIWTE